VNLEESIDGTQAIFFEASQKNDTIFEEFKTVSVFGQETETYKDTSSTESIFSSKPIEMKSKKHESFRKSAKKKSRTQFTVNKNKNLIIALVLLVLIGSGIFVFSNHTRTKKYQTLMEEATTLCATDPKTAAAQFLEA